MGHRGPEPASGLEDPDHGHEDQEREGGHAMVPLARGQDVPGQEVRPGVHHHLREV